MQRRRGDMLYRPLGSTGVIVSAIGLGGYHIGQQADAQESIRITPDVQVLDLGEPVQIRVR